MTQKSGNLKRSLNRGQTLWQSAMDRFRHRLSHLDALPQLTLLGFICGLGAAAVMILFRLIIDGSLTYLLPENSDNFESLSLLARLGLPIIGALLILAMWRYIPQENRGVSVGHVIERLHDHQGRMPLKNWIYQFFGGAISLISGHSVGREGPAVHLGAGVSSYFGQWLKLPNNSSRTLIACGVASAISASFNIPMSGVIFAMEVVLMEYTILGFIPVILASVTGALLARAVFGAEPAFSIAPIQLNTLWELPYIAASGLAIALFAALFIRVQLLTAEVSKNWGPWRLIVAAILTSATALVVPQVMGIGYDTIDLSMSGGISLEWLMIILVAKVLLTSISIGLGVPGGLIGPLLVIGACLGGILGLAIDAITGYPTANIGFYVILGMGGMMAAVINAPLAALMTVLELTYNPHIIFPGMLMIVVSVLATRQLFHCDGVFLASLGANGFALDKGLKRKQLDQVGVRSVMNQSFVRSHHKTTTGQLEQLIVGRPEWVLVDEIDREKLLVSAADLHSYIQSTTDKEQELNLIDVAARRYRLLPIQQQASLYEAQELLSSNKADALYVERQTSPLLSPVLGIITQSCIDNYYQ